MSRCICCKRKDECGCFPEAGSSSSYNEPVMCVEGHPAGCRDEDGWGACRWCADISTISALLERAEKAERERDALKAHYEAYHAALEEAEEYAEKTACAPLASYDSAHTAAIIAQKIKHIREWLGITSTIGPQGARTASTPCAKRAEGSRDC